MEELLNKLIEKGWKPRWLEAKGFDGEMYYVELFEHYGNWTMLFDGIEYSIRELVSMESWLWQFVCDKGLVENVNDYSWELYNWMHWQYEVYKNWYEWWKRWEQVDYEYRLIESALCNEKDLEKFLLDNIKVWK